MRGTGGYGRLSQFATSGTQAHRNGQGRLWKCTKGIIPLIPPSACSLALHSPLAMNHDTAARIRSAIRDVHDFPKPGIVFKDITPVLADPELFRLTVNYFVEGSRSQNVSKVVGIDARGFLFGAAVAYELGVGFVPVRKKGKLPWRCESAAYQLEYGEAVAEMHADALQPGERVVLIDDLLATGGTAAAAIKLINKIGATLVEAQFLIELSFLGGRQNLGETPVRSLLKFD